MHLLLASLLSLSSLISLGQPNIADFFQRLQDKYPPSQSETWIIHRVSSEENRTVAQEMNIPEFHADNYVIFETRSKRVIRDFNNQMKKIQEGPDYRLIYHKLDLPDVAVSIYAHPNGPDWVQAYAVFIQKEVAYFVYVDGSIPDAVFERYQTGIHQLMDKFATYLCIKAEKGERVDFFKILTTGKE